MNTKILIIFFAILLIFAGHALAGSVTITGVSVVPNQPLNTDLITFNISGMANQTSSWVDHDVFSQNGTSLQLDVYVDMGDLGSGSYWGYPKQIQPLTLGTYSLEIRAFDGKLGSPFYNTVQDIENTNFTVTPEPCAFALLGLGLTFLRPLAKKKV